MDTLLQEHLFAARTLPQDLSGGVKQGKSGHDIDTQLPAMYLALLLFVPNIQHHSPLNWRLDTSVRLLKFRSPVCQDSTVPRTQLSQRSAARNTSAVQTSKPLRSAPPATFAPRSSFAP